MTDAKPSSFSVVHGCDTYLQILPAEASAEQVSETRQAFYAGVLWLLQVCREVIPDLPDAVGVELLEKIHGDVAHVFQQIVREKVNLFHLSVRSSVGAATGQGFVEFVVNGQVLHMDLDKSREVIGMLQGAVEAAITDQLVFAFLQEKIGLPRAAAARALLDFREGRQGSRDVVFPS